MGQLARDAEKLILDCPCCTSKVAVPAAARGAMAKCLKCDGTFLIPMEDEELPPDPARVDDLVIELLEQAPDSGDTVPLTPVPNEEVDTEEETARMPVVEQAEDEDDDPPDIGDASTPEEVKQLRRERHKLLLAIGREANCQILSGNFDEFKARIQKVDKRARQLRAWLAAVDRASSDDNPLARRMDMNVDASKAAQQLKAIEKNNKVVLRALGEALVQANQHPKICPEQRERVQAIDAQLEALVPLPKKKGLLSRFRGE